MVWPDKGFILLLRGLVTYNNDTLDASTFENQDVV